MWNSGRRVLEGTEKGLTSPSAGPGRPSDGAVTPDPRPLRKQMPIGNRCGHTPWLEQPEAMEKALLELLAGIK